jgi:hypothetical protein
MPLTKLRAQLIKLPRVLVYLGFHRGTKMNGKVVWTIILVILIGVALYFIWKGFNNINDLVEMDINTFNGKGTATT